ARPARRRVPRPPRRTPRRAGGHRHRLTGDAVFKIALKSTLARRFRLLSTARSVMLGIAFLAGTLVFTDTIKRTFDDLFADVYQGTDAYVRPSAVTEDAFGGGGRGRVAG